ncbi:MAG TPA: proton-conducting transporter membrane subunit [Methanomassiliicoccales archaeon]|nr:proton-conducting transporter membrane subunit [Methanomassiliicoccales archaeon]
MDPALVLILLLMAVPVIGGLLSTLFGKGGKGLVTIVIATAIVTAVLSLALFGLMTANGTSSLKFSSEDVPGMEQLLFVLHYAFILIFVYLGLRLRNFLVLLFAVAQFIIALGFDVSGGPTVGDPAIIADYLSLTLALIASLVGSLICIYGLRYMEKDPHQGRFFLVMLGFLGAMNAAVFSNNLVWFFTFWEITTLCSYLLIRHEETQEAIASAVRALVYNIGGGVALGIGIILLNYYFGTVLISSIPAGAAIVGLAFLPIGLMAIGAFTKSAQIPFQKWLLGAMVAPTPVSALLHSSTMVNLGVYLLIRLAPAVSGVLYLQWIFGLVGGISFLVTAILAIGQCPAKKVLAYSTIGNLGLIVMCVGIGTPLAIAAGILLLLFHAISKGLLFLAVGVVKHETGSDDIDAMAGLRDRQPFVAFAMLVGVATIILPPFGMFASKFLISEAAVTFPLLTFLLGLGFGATVLYYLKWMGLVFSSPPHAGAPFPIRQKLSALFKVPIWGMMIGAVGLAVLINYVVQYLIDPYVPSIGSDNLSIFSGLGSAPIVALIVVVAIVFLLLAFFYNPKKEQIGEAYACGEPFAFELGGHYYFSGETERIVTFVTNSASSILLALLIVIPFILEAMK